MNISENYYSLKSNLLFVFAVPLFVLLFMVCYQPQFYDRGGNLMELWEQHDSFCLPIICAIIFLVLAISRTILCVVLVRHNLSNKEWLLWQITEWVSASAFVTLFVALYFHMRFFNLLPRMLITGFGLIVFPYVIYWLTMQLSDRDLRLQQAQSKILELSRGIERNEGSMIRFTDEKGNVKLVVGSDRVICLESAGNYVTVCYDDESKLVRYSLRNTLKGLETIASNNGLVRCHRSYFVNLSHIRTLKRTTQGVFAEIDHPGIEDIPVSKSYASELIRLFGN